MEISLPADLERFIDDQVNAGQFANATEVITDALRTMRLTGGEPPTGEELARLIAEGQAQADRGELLDGDRVFSDLLARNAARNATP